MKRKVILLLGVLAALTFGLALTACSQDRLTEEDLIQMGYVHRVTFDLAGGRSGERDELVQRVQDNSLVVEPGSSTLAGERPTRTGYTFNAFYTGTEDEDGNITYLERWDFSADRVTSDITLYARWLENYTITVHYGEDFSYTGTYTQNVNQTSEGVAQPVNSITISGQTIIQNAFYASEEDARSESNAITFPYTPADLTPENTVSELWANTLEGVWRMVYDASDFVLYSNTNIYLVNNIDFEGAELEFPETYSGIFEGNGHTLSNFTLTQERGNSRTQTYGLFRELRASAAVRNVTFENVTFTAMLTNPTVNEYRMGLVAGYAASGARVENVTLEGGSYTFVVTDRYADWEGLDERAIVGGNVPDGVVDTETCIISGTTIIRKLTPDEWEAENGE